MYINNWEFAFNKSQLSGKVNLNTIARIETELEFGGVLAYELLGNIDNKNRPILNLRIYGIITALCQNCLNKMEYSIDNTTTVTLFKNEEELNASLFSEADESVNDAILIDKEFDCLAFIEDEIILLLPYAPKHETCSLVAIDDNATNQFMKLKQYKERNKNGSSTK